MIDLFTRIRVRILLIVLMAVNPAIALIIYSASERKRQDEEEVRNNALRLSRFLASNLERDISEGEIFLHATAAIIGTQPASRADMDKTLSGLISSPSVYSILVVAHRDGSLVCSAFPLKLKTNLSKFDWFHVIPRKKTFTIGFDFNGVLGPEASINLGLPLPGIGSDSARILVAAMGLNWLNTLAEKSQLPAGSIISVTNRNGDAVARYPDPEKWTANNIPAPT